MSDPIVSDNRLNEAVQLAHTRTRLAAEARARFAKTRVGGDYHRATQLEAAAEVAWREVARLRRLQEQQLGAGR